MYVCVYMYVSIYIFLFPKFILFVMIAVCAQLWLTWLLWGQQFLPHCLPALCLPLAHVNKQQVYSLKSLTRLQIPKT